MHLILLCTAAWADRLYWTDPPAAADLARAEAAVPGARTVSFDELGGGAVAGDPARDIAALQTELAAVTPLLAEFDGELQVMSRLATAIGAVKVLRSEADADLLWRALIVQGFAVHRYFQDGLATEPAAGAYRTELAGSAVVAPWLEAATLFGNRQPTEADLPEPGERIAYDAIRAAVLTQPTARIELGTLPEGAEARVDGAPLTATPRLVAPGRHRIHVAQGELLITATTPTLGAGQTTVVAAPIGPHERAEIVTLTSTARGGMPVPAALKAALAGSTEPVYLAVPGKGEIWRVDTGTYTAVKGEKKASASPVAVTARLGGGWVSTGDFFLQNVDDGAPYTTATVNAGGISGGLDVAGRFGLFELGLAADGLYALGDDHALPSGNGDTRLFGWVHANVGLPWLQVAAGPLFPWYVGVGGQARVPILSRVELQAGGVYGIPVAIERSEGPTFHPEAAYAAWGGVGFRLN